MSRPLKGDKPVEFKLFQVKMRAAEADELNDLIRDAGWEKASFMRFIGSKLKNGNYNLKNKTPVYQTSGNAPIHYSVFKTDFGYAVGVGCPDLRPELGSMDCIYYFDNYPEPPSEWTAEKGAETAGDLWADEVISNYPPIAVENIKWGKNSPKNTAQVLRMLDAELKKHGSES